ncbi:MAG: SDR family oxidoreductase [Candidatus Helarchaeota archaeon]
MHPNKIVLITGVSGGIGYPIMEYFVDKVKYLITSSRKKLSQFSKFKQIPKNLQHIPLDLVMEENVIELFDIIKKRYGRLDLIINCVGGSLFNHPIEHFPIIEFDIIMAVNLKSAFLLTKYGIRLMKENDGGGNIIHFVSSSAKNISQGKAPYGIAKAGLAHLIHYAAYEAAKYNIKINGISPTYVFTPRHDREIDAKVQKTGKTRGEIVNDKISKQLIKRPMYPNDLLDVVKLLSSTQSITGQIYNVSMGEVLNY